MNFGANFLYLLWGFNAFYSLFTIFSCTFQLIFEKQFWQNMQKYLLYLIWDQLQFQVPPGAGALSLLLAFLQSKVLWHKVLLDPHPFPQAPTPPTGPHTTGFHPSVWTFTSPRAPTPPQGTATIHSTCCIWVTMIGSRTAGNCVKDYLITKWTSWAPTPPLRAHSSSCPPSHCSSQVWGGACCGLRDVLRMEGGLGPSPTIHLQYPWPSPSVPCPHVRLSSPTPPFLSSQCHSLPLNVFKIFCRWGRQKYFFQRISPSKKIPNQKIEARCRSDIW